MLDETGLTIKRLAEIKLEIEAVLRASYGDQINTTPESVIGQQVSIFSERESLLWELIQLIYDSQYPDTAEGASFDSAATMNAFTRLKALESTISPQAFFGVVSTVIAAGTILSVDNDSGSKFITDNEVTLIAGTDEVQTITFSATPTSGSFKLVFGSESTNLIEWDHTAMDVQAELNALSGLSGVIVSIFGGAVVVTFSGDDGTQPQIDLTSSTNTLDAGGSVTITIDETTPGVYQGTTTMTATVTGPTVANADTLTVIDNPIAGLNSTTNPNDATVGRDLETVAAARIRRRTRLVTSVAGPRAAIRNHVLRLNDVEGAVQLEDVKVIDNTTLSVDVRGIPGKAFEVFVYQAGGSTERDQEIFNAIGESGSAGIEPHGDEIGNFIDDEGNDNVVKFSRPTGVDIYLELDLTVTSDYPSDSDSQVETLIVLWGDSLGTGQDVIVFGSNALINQFGEVPGITDVVVRIGVAPSPTLDDNIVIDDGITPGVAVEISLWDTSNIIIAHV
jgi:uncharacterized phage protein gp47/JayE